MSDFGDNLYKNKNMNNSNINNMGNDNIAYNIDYNTRISYINKNNAIKKIEDFMIPGYYKNSYDKFKILGIDGLNDKSTSSEEKELYEKRIN